MGSRSRKRRKPPGEPRLRGEARNEKIRSELEPLGPGERPTAVTVAAVAAALLAVANLLAALLSSDHTGRDWLFTAVQFVVLTAAAAGMWRNRYWAVLGFQALLGLSCVIAGLSLMLAPSVRGALVSGAVLVLGGTLFWFLVRAMARIQMPERPSSVRRHG